QATASRGEVSALLLQPIDASVLYVLAHGAGAGMSHPFLDSVSRALAARGVATLRYQFPYMEAGGRRPDPPAIAQKTVRSAVVRAAETGLPLIAGGKSFGGRMTAYAAAGGQLPGVVGLAYLGVPLHPPGREGTDRWGPMTDIDLPMLFLQGDRDRLANLDLLRPVVRDLRPPGVLHVVEGGDHSFKVLKRSGRADCEVLTEIVDTLARWAHEVVAGYQ
ncbi:MAG: alpha/beta hydrolase, partial [Acidobacteria bacterium]|nr:alpha/beta hydrolase [Acidobacteriota bacterium]